MLPPFPTLPNVGPHPTSSARGVRALPKYILPLQEFLGAYRWFQGGGAADLKQASSLHHASQATEHEISTGGERASGHAQRESWRHTATVGHRQRGPFATRSSIGDKAAHEPGNRTAPLIKGKEHQTRSHRKN